MKATVVLALALLNATAALRAQQGTPGSQVPTPTQAPQTTNPQNPAATPPTATPAQTPGAVPAQMPAQPAADAPPAGSGQVATVSANGTDNKFVQVGADYVLGIDDTITVTVYKDPTFSGALMIRPDGKITLPLLGDVQAAGLTPMALAADLTEKLKKFILDPSVTVNVSSVNSKHIFFIGEVNKAGPMPLDPDMTVLQAISTAGGLSPYAKATKIYILRGPAGKQQKISFDYKKAVKTGNQQGVTLMAGDTIVVP